MALRRSGTIAPSTWPSSVHTFSTATVFSNPRTTRRTSPATASGSTEVHRGPERKVGKVAAHLEIVEVDEAHRRLTHVPGLRVPHHPHDLEWLAIAVEDDVSSDCVAMADRKSTRLN